MQARLRRAEDRPRNAGHQPAARKAEQAGRGEKRRQGVLVRTTIQEKASPIRTAERRASGAGDQH